MSEKELIELAAKAAGVVGEYVENYSPGDYYADQFYCGNELGILTGSLGCYHVWNPLTDDGDALRLAVKLQMEIHIDHKGVSVRTHCGFKALEKKCDAAATRRAIVRAAAEIGSKLMGVDISIQ